MRDPRGQIHHLESEIVRTLHRPIDPSDFLFTSCARQLIETQRLVEFTFRDPLHLVSPKIPFVTYPWEWTDAQLHDAAKLTLEICETILPSGFESKDASAWNIIFKGTRPIFCDHLSFEKIESGQWWGFGQYIRHFVLPLCLSRFRHIQVGNFFKTYRDGVSPEVAKNLMGLRRFSTRYWPLMVSGGNTKPPKMKTEPGKPYHENLYRLLRWYLDGLAPRKNTHSTWLNYTDERNHYSAEGLNEKKIIIRNWLEKINPQWVIDFGANTGEFTLIAKEVGAQVVAIDLDHDSVQKIYSDNPNDSGIYPVLANLDDLSGGRGWNGNEFPGLVERLTGLAEVNMMLALIHHLAIAISIPLKEIARLAHATTKKLTIVELLDSTDPMVGYLCAQRKRNPEAFNLNVQRQAFEEYFIVLEEKKIPETKRVLLLLEKK
jgi:hypothetical protein